MDINFSTNDRWRELKSVPKICLVLGAGTLDEDLARLVGTTSPLHMTLSPSKTVLEEVLGHVSATTTYVWAGKNWTVGLYERLNAIPGVQLLESKKKGGESRSIGESLSEALSQLDLDQPLEIRWADSCLTWSPQGDSIAVKTISWDPRWDYVTSSSSHVKVDHEPFLGTRPAIAGAFLFEEPGRLLKILQQGQAVHDFFHALESYFDHAETETYLHEVESWQDFGHFETYVQARANHVGGRQFNSFSASEKWVEKASHDESKTSREFFWLASPKNGKESFFPKVQGGEHANYKVEFLPFPTVAEKFVFHEFDEPTWRFITTRLSVWLESDDELQSRQQPGKNADGKHLLELFKSRLTEAERLFPSAFDEPSLSLERLVAISGELLSGKKVYAHGDLVFSNILCSSPQEGIFKLIDPRGGLADHTDFLPEIYDWGKLAQSIFFYYDLITWPPTYRSKTAQSGWSMFHKQLNKEKLSYLQSWFRAACPFDESAILLGALLLMTAAPLHSQENLTRAKMMVTNGIRGVRQWT